MTILEKLMGKDFYYFFPQCKKKLKVKSRKI